MIDFDEFCTHELEQLGRYARLLAADRDRAQDLLQDALIEAHRRWSRIAVMDHPAAYVRSIITTKHLGELRRWSFRHIHLTTTGLVPESSTPDPTSVVLDREHLVVLLASLNPRQRAAVVLRHYVGLSDSEIAEELGVSNGTVRSLISRGLSAIRLTPALYDSEAIRD